jgi:hypothetical protein
MSGTLRQPDDPGPSPGVCPHCGCRCKRDPDEVARKLIKANHAFVDKYTLARILEVKLEKLQRIARSMNVVLLERSPPIEQVVEAKRLKKEPEPRGA